MSKHKSLCWLVALAGLWEVIAAFVFGYTASPAALWNAIIVGACLIILGAWSAISNQVSTDKILDWINVVLGVWLVIAPFLLGYRTITAALWNDIIVGVIVVVLAGWAVSVLGSEGQKTA
jgi:hypothetical protein